MFRLEAEMKIQPRNISRDPSLVDTDHIKMLLETAMTLPRHDERNTSIYDSVGQYIMRKFGKLGLLTGTQVFRPSQFREKVSLNSFYLINTSFTVLAQ